MPPSRSGPDPVEPAQGPFNTGSEINEARNPSPASPAATPMAPVTSAGAVVSAAYRSLPAATKVPTMPAGSAALADIHPGSAASAPGFGSPRHCRAASSSRSTPSAILIQDTAADGSADPPKPALASAVNTPVATAMPATQPSRKPTLVPPAFAARSIRIAAMIGIGLIATPTASGSRSPMISFIASSDPGQVTRPPAPTVIRGRITVGGSGRLRGLRGDDREVGVGLVGEAGDHREDLR